MDEVLARKYFGNESPIGKRLFLEIGQTEFPAEIVGVAAHVKQWGLDTDDTESLRSQLYFPFMQLPDATMALSPMGMGAVVRSKGPQAGLFDSIRHSVQRVNSEQVVAGAQTMDEIISSSIASQRFSMILLGAFRAACVAAFQPGNLRRCFVFGWAADARVRHTHRAGSATWRRVAPGSR